MTRWGAGTRASLGGTALAQPRSFSHQPTFVLLPKAVAVANNLACRGLDHLEEKIPALQYPVDKVSHGWDSLGCPGPSAELTARLL